MPLQNAAFIESLAEDWLRQPQISHPLTQVDLLANSSTSAVRAVDPQGLKVVIKPGPRMDGQATNTGQALGIIDAHWRIEKLPLAAFERLAFVWGRAAGVPVLPVRLYHNPHAEDKGRAKAAVIPFWDEDKFPGFLSSAQAISHAAFIARVNAHDFVLRTLMLDADRSGNTMVNMKNGEFFVADFSHSGLLNRNKNEALQETRRARNSLCFSDMPLVLDEARDVCKRLRATSDDMFVESIQAVPGPWLATRQKESLTRTILRLKNGLGGLLPKADGNAVVEDMQRGIDWMKDRARHFERYKRRPPQPQI